LRDKAASDPNFIAPMVLLGFLLLFLCVLKRKYNLLLSIIGPLHHSIYCESEADQVFDETLPLPFKDLRV
jgi:hypothetical protein